MRLERLPGWVVDDDTSIREEVADFVGATPERLWAMTRACARAAVWALRFHDDANAATDRRDPLPQSTIDALARLRAAARRDGR